MPKLSEQAKLSKRYTNHCIRATCITNLDENGIETRHIMGLSGHKSESAVRSYTKRLGEKKQREMSDILNKCTKPDVEPPIKVRHESVSENNLSTVNNNLEDIDFLGDDTELVDNVLREIQNYEYTDVIENQNNNTMSSVPAVVTNCASNTMNTVQKFQIPQGFAIQNISNSNINFHFHQ